ncbi:DMT family transporter [Tenuibacillus multivorans]|uniref:Permease of the drug/metabolite transporter (DMT) superfamily n=1 Tax=Tenuibacillus multivorans TaxID=237069 RepID=A0A1H0G1G2_9BACI|nr:DMT family transporter [Tenuibacillus multivorans]GEL78122.1 multidrug DMT transporter [Tenuibacillus multivorans]SDO00681.1 Permease of the drug/metabolite transporter (DMT) superfamily [Tenuibacillus multivorans]
MIRSYIFLIVTVIIFSGNLLVGKAINELPPITIVFFRTLIAFLVILPFGIKQFRAYHSILRENWKPLVGIALTGITTFNVLVYLSLNFTTSTNAGIVEATTPAFAMILSYFILKESIHMRHIIGTIISFTGALWVLTRGSIDALIQLDFNPGDLTMLLAMIVWSFYTIIVKQHNHKFPVLGGTLVMIGLGSIFTFPAMMIEWLVVGFPEQIVEPSNMTGMLYLGIFPSVIALILWNQAVSDLGPSLSSVFLNLLPVFTTIGAIIFLGEKVVFSQIFGGLLVIIGVILVNVNLKAIKKGAKRDYKYLDKSKYTEKEANETDKIPENTDSN